MIKMATGEDFKNARKDNSSQGINARMSLADYTK
jgi:hypothetical protein